MTQVLANLLPNTKPIIIIDANNSVHLTEVGNTRVDTRVLVFCEGEFFKGIYVFLNKKLEFEIPLSIIAICNPTGTEVDQEAIDMYFKGQEIWYELLIYITETEKESHIIYSNDMYLPLCYRLKNFDNYILSVRNKKKKPYAIGYIDLKINKNYPIEYNARLISETLTEVVAYYEENVFARRIERR